MELRDYLEILARRRWIIIITAIFTLIVVTLGVGQTPPKYTATTKIRVLTTRTGGADYIDYDVSYAERLQNTFTEMAKSSNVIEELSKYVDKLPKINAKVVSGTELIQIDVEDEDPARAQFTANKLSQILIDQSRKLYSGDVSPVNIYVAEPADIPTQPSSPHPLVIIGLGLVVGLVGGIGLAILFESLDTRLYSTKQIENLTQLPVLGDIPDDHDLHPEDGLFKDSRLHIEAFRRLHTNIFSHAENETLQAFLITSPVTKDGKSTVVANLALSIAQGNHSVIVVDANLRWPTIQSMFNLSNERGLSDVLQQKAKLADVIQPTKYPEIHVITSGKLPVNPVELLQSDQMAILIVQLKQLYDVVLLDSPASLTVTDPAVIAPNVDGVLLVVRQAWVRREALQATLKHLNTVKANLVGVIANRTGLGTSSRFSKKHTLLTSPVSIPGGAGTGKGKEMEKERVARVEDQLDILGQKLDKLVDTLVSQQQESQPKVEQIKKLDTQVEDLSQRQKQNNQNEGDPNKRLDDLLDSLRK
ncbi:MAG: polysaccharide biosynthesis tyrosine autokinase [Anaerolineales bacterium]|nr:polysaccharide biosynthesis tyrosine autokinase [Anaerolineales bacterium]